MNPPKAKRKLLSIGIAPHDGIICFGISPHRLISIGAIPHGLVSIGLVPMDAGKVAPQEKPDSQIPMPHDMSH